MSKSGDFPEENPLFEANPVPAALEAGSPPNAIISPR